MLQKILGISVLSTSILLTASGFAHADTSRDAAYDARKSVVTDRNGNCVRTKWSSLDDVCAPKAIAAPAPAPVVVEQPRVRALSELTTDDKIVYFDFDKAVLTAHATSVLDKLIEVIRNSQRVVKANIVGHTDEMGANTYNQKLSERRAHAVENYLQTHGNIDAEVVALSAVGSAYPVVTNCGKSLGRDARINCLQSNRRVEIHLEVMQEATR